jgi:hypothetical protein
MRQSDRVKLHFGPYRTPRFRIGAKVQCAIRGELVIVGMTDGRIPWPLGIQGRGSRSLVVFHDLVRAIKQESHLAIVFWWGARRSTVQGWRRTLGVPRSNPGTNRLRARYARSPSGKRARSAALAVARDPERRRRISAGKLGLKPSPEAVAKMRAKLVGRKLSAEHRQRIAEGVRRARLIPPAAGKPWSAKEEQLLRTLPAWEVAKRTGRSLMAVYSRRRTLGLNNGRTARHEGGGRNEVAFSSSIPST